MVSGKASEFLIERTGARDPTLFALVHPLGFSGAAWLRQIEFPYQPTNPVEPIQWLKADSATLAREFMQFVQTNPAASTFAAVKPAPPRSQFADVGRPLLLQPSLKIEGKLAARKLLKADPLPLPDPEMILSNCVVAIVVAASGAVLSEALLTSCGSPKTDQEALRFASSARFAPRATDPFIFAADPSSAEFGRLVFQWSATSVEAVVPALGP